MQPADDVAAAMTAAASPDYSVRARAGRELARHADRRDIADVLVGLLLDQQDTAVTDVTAEALLRRDDTDGIRLLARAVANGDDQHLDHLYTEVQGHLQDIGAVRRFHALCSALAADADPDVSAGTRGLLHWVEPWMPVE